MSGILARKEAKPYLERLLKCRTSSGSILAGGRVPFPLEHADVQWPRPFLGASVNRIEIRRRVVGYSKVPRRPGSRT
jgi:hypothetical protein